jgi:hypothetical protein
MEAFLIASAMVDPKNTGRKASNGFLLKLFSRQSSISKPSSNEPDEALGYAASDDVAQLTYSGLKVMPCPYIRPLENKLEPRVERSNLPTRRPGTATSTDRHWPGITSPPTHNGPSVQEQAGVDNGDSTISPDTMSCGSPRLCEDIAATATADPSHLKDWSYYIKCYSEVSFRICKPSFKKASDFGWARISPITFLTFISHMTCTNTTTLGPLQPYHASMPTTYTPDIHIPSFNLSCQ